MLKSGNQKDNFLKKKNYSYSCYYQQNLYWKNKTDAENLSYYCKKKVEDGHYLPSNIGFSICIFSVDFLNYFHNKSWFPSRVLEPVYFNISRSCLISYQNFSLYAYFTEPCVGRCHTA